MKRRGFLKGGIGTAVAVATNPLPTIARLAETLHVKPVIRAVNPNFDQMLTTTLANHRAMLIDGIFEARPLAHWVKDIPGQVKVTPPIMKPVRWDN